MGVALFPERSFGQPTRLEYLANRFQDFGMVTSLNLYDFSQANNQEMGILFSKSTEPDLYHSVAQEALRIVRISGGDAAERSFTPSPVPRVQEAPETFGKLTTAKLAEKLGLQTTAL